MPPSTGSTVAALAVASLLGGGAALGGAALLGAFDGKGRTTTVVERVEAPVASAAAVATTGLSVAEIYRRTAPGVVQVNASGSGSRSEGSGFMLDKAGHIVTNYHVIARASEIEVSFSNQDTLPATLVGQDPSTDLAVLKVDENPRGLTALRLGDSDAVDVGDPVVAIGNPFGLERTVTSGIVSAVQRAVTAPNGFTIDHVIQTDAAINHGNSGGPLLNDRGEVIGVNSQIETGGSGAGNVGIGFAVPSNTVKTVVAQIMASGKVEHAYLGVLARPLTGEIARIYRLPIEQGLLVEEVTSGSAADRAGLRGGDQSVVVSGESYRMGGDIVIAAEGRRVADIDELRAVIAAKRPGDRLRLTLYRDGERVSVTVTLGRQPSSLARLPG